MKKISFPDKVEGCLITTANRKITSPERTNKLYDQSLCRKHIFGEKRGRGDYIFKFCIFNMMDCGKITKLENYEDEDIFDVVFKLEKSFRLKFKRNSFAGVNSFGDLSEVIISKFQMDNSSDCASQQAFYKLRNAIGLTQGIDKGSITPNTELAHIFPGSGRAQIIRKLQAELGISLNILDIRSWLGRTIFIGVIISLLGFFIRWQIAVSGLLFFFIIGWFAYRFYANEFTLGTVGQLTQKLVRENYAGMRRTQGTVNRQEVERIIIDTFSHDLDIDKAYLTKNDKFNWAT